MSADALPTAADVRDLLLRILRVCDRPPDAMARAQMGEWDSLRHMEIVFALEDRYGVRFDESEFPTLDSAAAIACALRRHLAP